MAGMNGGLVGFGFIAERGHVPAYRAREGTLDIVAVAEPCEARHAAVRQHVPRARIYPNAEQMLEAERLDFVDICAPPSEHAPVARAAFSRGLHVLCEKPLALDSTLAHEMADRARAARRVLYPGHSYRHAPVVRAVQGILDRGRLGKVHMVTMETFRTGNAKGVREWRPDWRREKTYAGGGILMDHGPHTFYLAFDWLGSYPTHVATWTSTMGTGEVDDEVSCSLTFPTGMVRAHLTWNASFRRVIYTLHGEHGAIRVEDDDLELVLRAEGGGFGSEKAKLPSDWMDAGHGPWFEGVLDGFVRAIRSEDWVSRETEDSVRAMEVISAAYSSAREGGRARAIEPGLPRRAA